MPKVTEAHMETRRNQILEAACICFSEKGFHQTTIRDICRAAGLSAGAVYGHFTCKDDIIEGMARLGRQNTRAFVESARTDDGAVRSLANIVRVMVEHLDSESGTLSSRLDVVMWGEALHTPKIHELFVEALADICEPIAEIVQDGQLQGEIADGVTPEDVARTLIALGLGLTVLKAMHPETPLANSARMVSTLLDSQFSGRGKER